MTKLVFIISTLFLPNVFANETYNLDTVNGVQSIYWLNKDQDGAIVYAKHFGFIQLKNLVDTVILTSQQVDNSQFNMEEAEQLLLMLPASNKCLVIYFTKDQLSYDGHTYFVDPNSITKITQLNDYRINKGDSISHKSLNKVKDRLVCRK